MGLSQEQAQVGVAQAALIEAIRGGRDLFQVPVFAGCFANDLAAAIEAVVEARIAVREREILDYLKAHALAEERAQ